MVLARAIRVAVVKEGRKLVQVLELDLNWRVVRLPFIEDFQSGAITQNRSSSRSST
jgi:hypothetical protein